MFRNELIKNNESHLPEYWVHLRPSTPIRNPELIRSAVAMFTSTNEFDFLDLLTSAVTTLINGFFQISQIYFNP